MSCSRISGEVSMRTRVAPSPSNRSTRREQRVRRFFGFAGSQAPQTLPMRGTPPDDPQPRMVNLRRAISRAPRRTGEEPVEVRLRRGGELLVGQAEEFRTDAGGVGGIGRFVA